MVSHGKDVEWPGHSKCSCTVKMADSAKQTFCICSTCVCLRSSTDKEELKCFECDFLIRGNIFLLHGGFFLDFLQYFESLDLKNSGILQSTEKLNLKLHCRNYVYSTVQYVLHE